MNRGEACEAQWKLCSELLGQISERETHISPGATDTYVIDCEECQPD